jgi:hypothetical protein
MEQKYKVVEYHLIPVKVEGEKKLQPATEYRVVQAGLTWLEAKKLRKDSKLYTIVAEHPVGNLEKETKK